MSATVINRANEVLWKNNRANGKIDCFDVLPNATLTTKRFDTVANPIQRTVLQLERIGFTANTANKALWLYEGGVKALLGERIQPNGLETLSNAELDAIATSIAGHSEEYILTDHEGPDAWWEWPAWSYTAGQKISYIANKVDQLTGGAKKYFDWFHKQFFDFNGKQLGSLTDKGVWQSNGASVDDYLDFYQNPGAATNHWNTSPIGRGGWGYTNVTYKVDNASQTPLPANVHLAPIAGYLKSLCGINTIIAVNPNKHIVYIIWGREDEGAYRQHYQQVRFKPKSLDGSVDPSGYVRLSDNRLTYASNLIQDNVFVAACHPRVKKLHAWILPTSEDPVDILRYSKRNGNNACSSALLPFTVANYTGNDNPPCNISAGDYYADEALGFNAIMAGLNRFAPYQDILDGTQVGSSPAYSFKREGAVAYTSKPAITDLSEYARSWKDRSPWIKVWNKPSNNKKVVLFQHPFADACEPIPFKVTIGGTEYSYTANGNEVFAFKID